MCVDTTQLLHGLSQGDGQNVELLFEHVYSELRALAASKLKAERPGHTLQPTALVNELYLRMSEQSRVVWRDRSHFMAMAATFMRRVLIDHARSKGAERRGGGRPLVSIDDVLCLNKATDPTELVALADCLDKLASLNERHACIVEMKVFGGLTVDEMSSLIGVSPATVKNDWRTARAWIRSQLNPGS